MAAFRVPNTCPRSESMPSHQAGETALTCSNTIVRVPRHHLVPRLYLRRFDDTRQNLVAIDRESPHRSRMRPVKPNEAQTCPNRCFAPSWSC